MKSSRPSVRRRARLLAILFLPLFALGLMGSIRQPQTLTRMEMARGIASILPGTGADSDLDVAGLFFDISAEAGTALRPILERGLMQGYPDGSFRPDEPVRWAEWLTTWSRLLSFLRPELALVEVEAAWPEAEIALLSRAELPLPTAIAQKHLAGQVPDDEFATVLESTRLALRLQPPRTAVTTSADAVSADGAPVEVTLGRAVRPASRDTQNMDRQEATAPAEEPAAGFRLRGKLLDALSRQPVTDAQLIIDQKVVPLTPDGEFHLEGLRRQQVIEVLITADGYQSLSFKHRVGYKSFLQLLLKPYRASLRLNLVSAGTGEPVDGATVTLAGKALEADWMGKVAFSGLTPGYQKVLVSAPGFKPTETVVFVEEKTSQRTVRLQPATP